MDAVLFRKMADYVGVLAFYPIFYLIGLIANILILALASKIIYFVFSVLLGWTVYRLARMQRNRRLLVGGTLLMFSGALALTLYLFASYADWLVLFVILVLDALPIALIGLIFHELSKLGKTVLFKEMDKYGGVIILSVFMFLINIDITLIAGLILLVYGLYKSSNNLRYIYIAKMRDKKVES